MSRAGSLLYGDGCLLRWQHGSCGLHITNSCRPVNTWRLRPVLCYLPKAPTQLLGPTRPRLGQWRLRVATVPLDMQQTGQALPVHH